MKIYLASNRENIALVKAYAAKLEELGHTITYEWWRDIETNGPDDTKIDGEILLECAESDQFGVMTADLFWLLAPREGGTGCWIELGMAIRSRELEDSTAYTPPHIVISGAFDRTLFATLNEVDECFAEHESAFTFITTVLEEDLAS